MTDDSLVQRGALNKWIATIISIGVVVWGVMGYYVQAEDKQTRYELQSQIDILKIQQDRNDTVSSLVTVVDRKLANIEANLQWQKDLVVEVRELRTEVNALKIAVAKIQ